MRVLIACEQSGVVRRAFRELGHDAWSCDILPSEDGSEFHYEGDIFRFLNYTQPYDDTKWDLMIAHPPCTRLSVSGNAWAKGKEDERAKAVDFFLSLYNSDIPRICVENPVGIMSTVFRKPDQYIQPWEYGEDASKKTGLWLKNLPKLVPTQLVEPRVVNGKPRWANQTDSGQNKLGPSEDRAKIRSRTYEGIAKAMAEQWGALGQTE